jgi:6-phosphogluconolactonase
MLPSGVVHRHYSAQNGPQPRMREVEIFPDRDALARAAARRIVAFAQEAVAARGRFSLALAGGETPRPLYQRLAEPPLAAQIDWSRAHVFFGDERCVPPDHPESNYRMAREALLDRVDIPASSVHRIAGEGDPHDAARAYEHTLRAFFGTAEGPPRRSFDILLLGMGDDGHTASLFPGTPPVAETRRWVMPNEIARDLWRVTLTPVVLNAASAIVFVVAGASKADGLELVLGAGEHAAMLPAARIRPTHGALYWMVDVAAAAKLRRTS